MRRKILFTGLFGVAGAFLMFSGDMLLYFTPGEYNPAGGLMEYVRIMAALPAFRIMLGGFLGPVAAFVYCIGFVQLYYAIKPTHSRFARIMIGALGLSYFIGGAYHAQFGSLALAVAGGGIHAAENMAPYVELMLYGMIAVVAMVMLVLTVMILTKRTYYPRWFVLLTPAVLIWLPRNMLPQPFRIVISGGYFNIMFIIFFAASTILLLSAERKGLTE